LLRFDSLSLRTKNQNERKKQKKKEKRKRKQKNKTKKKTHVLVSDWCNSCGGGTSVWQSLIGWIRVVGNLVHVREIDHVTDRVPLYRVILATIVHQMRQKGKERDEKRWWR